MHLLKSETLQMTKLYIISFVTISRKYTTYYVIQTAFTRYRHILKTMKNAMVAKFELAFTRCRTNLKTVGNLPVKSSLQDFDAKEVNPKNGSFSFQKCPKMFYFHHF